MIERTVAISAQGRCKIPDALYAMAATIPEGTTVVINDERDCVEYVISVRDNMQGIFGRQ